MKKNGFTLIELLAVIVILGIIAVITIPKINSQVEDSKKNIAKTSALNYKKGISEYIYYQEMKENYIDLSGRYYVNEDGYLYNSNKTLEVSFDGQKPKNGNLTYINDELTSGCLTINKYKVTFINGEVSDVDKGTCEYNENQSIPEIVTSGDGLYASETELGRLIYRGTNPDNYISLKENNVDTMYRIVSYETDGTIKVVRNEPIQRMPFDERTSETEGPRKNSNNTYCDYSESYYNGCNVWGNTNNTYYNGNKIGPTFKYKYYENAASNTLKDSTNTGTVTQDSSLNTYLNETWIDILDFKDNIDEHSFNVGGINYYKDYEGGDKGIKKEKEEEKVYTWKGKIGVLNISEYKEGSINSVCTSVYANFYWNPENFRYLDSEHISHAANYNATEWPCSIKNWIYRLHNDEASITATPYSTDGFWFVGKSGYFSYNGWDAYGTFDIRPAFYLKSTTNLTGNGTETNPYQIEES